jgi:hypothetical protein
MTEESPSTTKRLFGIFRRKEEIIFEPWEELRRQEAAAGLALLEERRRNERFEKRLKNFLSMWPVGVGLFLSIISPLLRQSAESWGPWGATLLFPFVVLAERPELQVGPITHYLPTVMLYLQFPIEGLLARIILRRPVLPISVTIQVLLFHFLGIVEVWMLNGPGQPPPVIR